MKKVTILGSTGSVGKNALSLIREFPEDFSIEALAAKTNVKELIKQAREFRPKVVCIYDENLVGAVKKALPLTKVVTSQQGLIEVSTLKEVSQVLFALSGSLGIQPCLEAIDQNKTILLANKEILVSAGDLIMKKLREKKGLMIPVDSEHSAIFQALLCGEKSAVKRVILTASGGPFFFLDEKDFSQIQVEDALKHPNWKMGKKISVDSSTMMNKGLEIIEAKHLFDLEPEKISVIVHPESIIHSFVEYEDGNLIAQMAEPDMRIPLSYAFSYPKRMKRKNAPFSFEKHASLTFHKPNLSKFPCLALAHAAIREKSSFSCAMNAANEVLVERFLQKKLSWKEIGEKLEKILSSHHSENMLSLQDVIEVDCESRKQAEYI